MSLIDRCACLLLPWFH